MAALPKPTSLTAQAIFAWHEGQRDNDPARAYLGASVLGRPCDRALWYGFRWAASEAFEGRMLRLFERGQREEAVFVAELRAIGATVHDLDPRTGQQFRFTAVFGHVGGSMDAAALGILEAPKTWHVCEFKTHNAKSFANVSAKGVLTAKPEHWAQMQLYMFWSGMDRALYLAVNKDTDEIYAERVRADKAAGEKLEKRAEAIVFAPEPLSKLSDNPAWYECKFCPAHAVCHGKALPPVSCRTCVHATPERDGNGRWSCAKHQRDLTVDQQRAGCESHRYIPALVTIGTAIDANEFANWVKYRMPDGREFCNDEPGVCSYTSAELFAADPAILCDPAVDAIRCDGGRFVLDDGPPPNTVTLSADAVIALSTTQERFAPSKKTRAAA